MSDGPNGSVAMQKAAESALLQVVARWLIIAICTTALPIGAWFGNRCVTALDELTTKVEAQTTDIAVIKTDISYLKQRVVPDHVP